MISNNIGILLIITISLFGTIIEGLPHGYGLLALGNNFGRSPLPRYKHSSIILGNNLYFLGGYVKDMRRNEMSTNDFVCIDLSKPFDSLNPQFMELTTIASPPVRFSQSSLVPNGKGNGFYVIGGEMYDINDDKKLSYDNLIYEYNEDTKIWSVPNIDNVPNFFKLTEFNSVYDQNHEKTYIFGGIYNDNPTTIPEMQIFDGESLSWSISSSNDLPVLESLFGYTATLLPNGIIVYIGGDSIHHESVGLADRNFLSIIHTYDTTNDNWKHIEINAQGIDARNGHTAVLASDNRIIVYGGARNDDLSEALPQLIVLDTNVYDWIIPNTTTIASRNLHTANMFGNYMIVSFGEVFNPATSFLTHLTNEIHILDTRTYQWVNSIHHYVKNGEPAKKSGSFLSGLPTYIQATIYCAGGLIVITVLFLTYYSIKQRKKVRTRRASVMAFTSCNEAAKEDIINEYAQK